MRFLVKRFSAAQNQEPEALPWPPPRPGRRRRSRRWLPWIAGLVLTVGVVGAGVSMGAPDGGEDAGLRPSADRGREQVMALLARKEKALEERERDLIDKEQDLRAAQAEVEQRIQELQKLRQEIRKELTALDEDREKRVTHLVKMFESMRPKQAAPILAVTEDAVALEVLERMNRDTAGKILAAMPADRAAFFAEQIGDAALRVESP